MAEDGGLGPPGGSPGVQRGFKAVISPNRTLHVHMMLKAETWRPSESSDPDFDPGKQVTQNALNERNGRGASIKAGTGGGG